MIITAQAFAEVPKRHTLAVAVGLVPAMGAWALLIIEQTLFKAGARLHDVQSSFGANPADIFIHGVIALNQGFIITSMVLAAIVAYIIDRQFCRAAAWTAAAAVLAMLGIIHAYELSPNGIQNKFGLWAAPQFAIAYAITALILLIQSFSLSVGRSSSQEASMNTQVSARNDSRPNH